MLLDAGRVAVQRFEQPPFEQRAAQQPGIARLPCGVGRENPAQRLHSRPPEFERRVSRACAFVLRCEKQGLPYRLWIGDRLGVDASGGGARTPALTFLAQVDAGGEAPVEGGPP